MQKTNDRDRNPDIDGQRGRRDAMHESQAFAFRSSSRKESTSSAWIPLAT